MSKKQHAYLCIYTYMITHIMFGVALYIVSICELGMKQP